MAAKLKYDVMAAGGKYTDRDGNEKTRWIKCGVVLQNEKGFSMKLESIPLVSDGWFSFFEPKKKEDQKPAPAAAPAAAPATGDPDDDIPF